MAKNEARLKRRKAESRGRLSEYIAALYLSVKGYRILAIRYRTRVGEIDLIVGKGDLVAFVEVKARAGEQAAIDAVSLTAQSRIQAASDLWLAKQKDGAHLSRRYDLVAVLPRRLPRHFPDAF